MRHRNARVELWYLGGDRRDLGDDLLAHVCAHAFDVLGLDRLARLVPEYLVGVTEKAVNIGFASEGVLKRNLFRRGRWWDVDALGLVPGAGDVLQVRT